ncbi:hypothetical protein K1719_015078 [Acacia pycnantha]|nr:hypothetical protein K1719_015078 [Acacia pycnantha]
MDDSGGSKLSGIKQIVRLKEMIQKWQSVTLGSKVNGQPSGMKYGGIAPVINRRLKNVMYCDSDEESCQSPEPPPDVPKGYLAVYVGPELRSKVAGSLSHVRLRLLNTSSTAWRTIKRINMIQVPELFKSDCSNLCRGTGSWDRFQV